MAERKEDYQKKIEEQMNQEMEEIECMLANCPEFKEQKVDASVKDKIDAKITSNEYEDLISQLPEEYQEDLRRGRKAREEQERKATHKKFAYWKRVAAAVVVVALVGSMGINSVGGPKRIVEWLQTSFAGREVDKVIVSKEDEQVKYSESVEESTAYQQIKDELGIDPVRLIRHSDDMKFTFVEVDSYMQMAYMLYCYNDWNVSYTMQCLFTDGVWASDIEDEIIEEFPYELEWVTVNVTEYLLPESDMPRYEARFEYQGVEYQLIATMEWEEFELLLKNLYFL